MSNVNGRLLGKNPFRTALIQIGQTICVAILLHYRDFSNAAVVFCLWFATQIHRELSTDFPEPFSRIFHVINQKKLPSEFFVWTATGLNSFFHFSNFFRVGETMILNKLIIHTAEWNLLQTMCFQFFVVHHVSKISKETTKIARF